MSGNPILQEPCCPHLPLDRDRRRGHALAAVPALGATAAPTRTHACFAPRVPHMVGDLNAQLGPELQAQGDHAGEKPGEEGGGLVHGCAPVVGVQDDAHEGVDDTQQHKEPAPAVAGGRQGVTSKEEGEGRGGLAPVGSGQASTAGQVRVEAKPVLRDVHG